MTGKQSKNGGFWQRTSVLPLTARKLRLNDELEYLNLDLVFFPKGEPWGNFVAIEHENVIEGFGEELEKLMSVLAPLKVGISLGDEKQTADLWKTIGHYFSSRHPSIRQSDRSEYLFLLGSARRESFSWKYLSFVGLNQARISRFQHIGNHFPL